MFHPLDHQVESIRKSAAETPWATRDQNIARLKNQQCDRSEDLRGEIGAS